MNTFEEIKNRSIDQSDRPASISKKDAEKIIREVMSNHYGEDFEEGLFIKSVDELMEEINGHA